MEEGEAWGQEAHLFMKEQVVQPAWGVGEVQRTGRWGQAWQTLKLGPWTGSKHQPREMEEMQNSDPLKQNLHCNRIPRWFGSHWSLRSIRKSLQILEPGCTQRESTRSLHHLGKAAHLRLPTALSFRFSFLLLIKPEMNFTAHHQWPALPPPSLRRWLLRGKLYGRREVSCECRERRAYAHSSTLLPLLTLPSPKSACFPHQVRGEDSPMHPRDLEKLRIRRDGQKSVKRNIQIDLEFYT